jgi:hypothetical protein
MSHTVDSLIQKIAGSCKSISGLFKANDYAFEIEAKCEKKLTEVLDILTRIEKNLNIQVKENQAAYSPVFFSSVFFLIFIKINLILLCVTFANRPFRKPQ